MGKSSGVKTQAVHLIRKYSGGQFKERAQLTLVATEDGRIVPEEFDVALACIVDDSHELAWLERADCQNREDGKWYQAVSERSIVPLTFQGQTVNEAELDTIRDGIYARAVEQAKNRKYREAKQGSAYDRLVWIACTGAVVAIVALALNSFGSKGDETGYLPVQDVALAGVQIPFMIQMLGAVILAGGVFLWRYLRNKKKKKARDEKYVQDTLTQEAKVAKLADLKDEDRTEEERKARRKQIAEQLASGEISYNALVVDKWTFGREYLETQVIEKLKNTTHGIGRQWRYGVDVVYWLERKGNALIPVTINETLGHLPGDLWDALQVDDVDMVYDMKRPQGLGKYAPYLIVFGISIFALIVAMNR
jgi:hypothetical protein